MSLMTIVIWCAVLLRVREICERQRMCAPAGSFRVCEGVPLLVAPGRSFGVDGRHRGVYGVEEHPVSAGGFYFQAGVFDPRTSEGMESRHRSLG